MTPRIISFTCFLVLTFLAWSAGAETLSAKFPFAHNSGEVAIQAIPTRGLNAGGGFRSSGTLFADGDSMTFEHSLTVRNQNISAGAEATLIGSTSGAYDLVAVSLPGAVNITLTNTSCQEFGDAAWQVNGSPWSLGTGGMRMDWTHECVYGGGSCPSDPSYYVSEDEGADLRVQPYCMAGDRMCAKLIKIWGGSTTPELNNINATGSCIVAR